MFLTKRQLWITLPILFAPQFLMASQGEIETLTVTASRQAQDTQNLSLASIQAPEDVRAMHVSEILTQSPGTWVSRGNGQESLTAVRSPVLTGAGGCGPFLMTEDNVSLRAPAFCNVNQLFDANFEQAGSIETLRGPGTAFHGSNAMHGVINIISPNFTNNPFTVVRQEYQNSHDFFRTSVDHRSNHWQLQWNGSKDNGYKDDSGYKQQKLRAKYLQQGSTWSLTHNMNIAYLDQETAAYVVGKDAYKDDARKKENPNPDAFRKAKSWRYQAQWDLDINEASHLLITPYARANEMEFLMHFAPSTPLEENGHHSLGFLSAYFVSITDSISITSGLDFDYTDGFLKQTQEQPSFSTKFPQGPQYDYDVNVTTTAAFIQGEFLLGQNTTLSLGNRWEYARYDYTNNLSDGSACVASEPNCRYTRPSDDVLSFYNWSPKLSLSWNYLGNNIAYITTAKAFRAPQTNELFRLEQNQTVAKIDSEELASLELGFKGFLFDDIDYQLSFYHIQKDNVIFKNSDRANVDNQKTRHKGAELSIQMPINNQLSVSTQLSYAKHQYDSNIELFGSSSASIKGNIIDTAPRHLHNVIVSWLPASNAKVDFEWVYLGNYFLDPENTFSYEGHKLVNIRYQQQLPKGWSYSVGLLNATDVDYADRADITVALPGNPSQERYFIGEPRSFKLSVAKVF